MLATLWPSAFNLRARTSFSSVNVIRVPCCRPPQGHLPPFAALAAAMPFNCRSLRTSVSNCATLAQRHRRTRSRCDDTSEPRSARRRPVRLPQSSRGSLEDPCVAGRWLCPLYAPAGARHVRLPGRRHSRLEYYDDGTGDDSRRCRASRLTAADALPAARTGIDLGRTLLLKSLVDSGINDTPGASIRA